MASERKRELGRFWLKLLIAYLVLIVVWPLVRSPYERILGELAAVLVPVLAVERTEVRGVTAREELWFYLTVYSVSPQQIASVDYHLDAHQEGYGHIIFTALAVAVPGWALRKRLARWLIGTVALEVYFVLMVVLNLFCVVGGLGMEIWRGDWLTRIVPPELFLKHRGFIAQVTANLVPAIAWLGLFAFPLFKFNAKDGSVVAFRNDGLHARVSQPKG